MTDVKPKNNLDELHDRITASARDYVIKTPPDRRDPTVHTIARMQADIAVLRRDRDHYKARCEELKCCGNCTSYEFVTFGEDEVGYWVCGVETKYPWDTCSDWSQRKKEQSDE